MSHLQSSTANEILTIPAQTRRRRAGSVPTKSVDIDEKDSEVVPFELESPRCPLRSFAGALVCSILPLTAAEIHIGSPRDSNFAMFSSIELLSYMLRYAPKSTIYLFRSHWFNIGLRPNLASRSHFDIFHLALVSKERFGTHHPTVCETRQRS